MMISESLEEQACRRVEQEGGSLDRASRWFYIKEGTEPTKSMKVLKALGWIGQFEIR